MLKAHPYSEATLKWGLEMQNGTENVVRGKKNENNVLLKAANRPCENLGMKCDIPGITVIQNNI